MGTATSPSDYVFEVEDSLEAVHELFESRGWTDGLPIIPPTPERVDAAVRYTDRDRYDVVAILEPRKGEATVERIAINAVMAGCRPEYLPVLIAAVEAVARPEFNLGAVQGTGHLCAVLMLINGPIGRELGINHGNNCFGPGWRANATLGRALRLILTNIGGGIPGAGDRSAQGSSAKFTYCAAENEAANPWEPLHVERGYRREDSVVTVFACEPQHSIVDPISLTAEGFLTTVAGAMKEAGHNHWLTHGGEPLLALAPQKADLIARNGWTKADVKRFLWERARLTIRDCSPEWPGKTETMGPRDQWVEQREWFPIAEHWSRFSVIVTGGPGGHSSWMPGFGSVSNSVSRRIERADGTPLASVTEFGPIAARPRA